MMRSLLKSLPLTVPPVRRLYGAVIEANAENAALRACRSGGCE